MLVKQTSGWRLLIGDYKRLTWGAYNLKLPVYESLHHFRISLYFIAVACSYWKSVEGPAWRATMSGIQELPEFEWEEIAKHNNKSSLWIVIHDCIYDITSFMEEVS